MPVVPCPHGCGGVVNTTTDSCPSCRRFIQDTEVILDEDAVKVLGFWGWQYPDASPVHRKISWCWTWFGSADHRMRCRLPIGHEGGHDTHEVRRENVVIVSTEGQVISGDDR